MKDFIVQQAKTVTLPFFWGKGDIASREIRIRLVAAGAGIEVRGAFFAERDEELPIRLEVLHEAPNTRSNIILRGMVSDRASMRVHERAVLMKGAKGAETHVEARAILRSDQAKAELEPYLEIDEDDVRATHSASVRPLEEEEIFYIMSRGIEREHAERILLEAFFAPVASVIKNRKIPIL